jgi:hypothetical protein
MDLAKNLGFESIPQFNIEPQKRIEKLLGFVGEKEKRKRSVDVVWNYKLLGYGTNVLAKKVFTDIVVAWEVDISSNSQKTLSSSIDNLDRINPRLGVELLLIGTNLRSIRSYERKFKNAVDIARNKKSRIIVIHDIHFSILYNSIKNKHPEKLYNIYIDTCKKDNAVACALREKMEELLKTSKMKIDFKEEFQEKLLDQIIEI